MRDESVKRDLCRLPERLAEESIRLMNEFCHNDPDGVFDESEWEQFFNANASTELKRAIEMEKRVIASTPPGIHI